MDVESVDRVLSTTRSVRRRLDFERPVEPEVIEACIDIATQAPTGLDRESWRFLVVTDPAKKRGVADLYRKSFEGMAERWAELAETLDLPQPPGERSTHRALAERLQDLPVLILVCAVGEPVRDDPVLEVSFYGSIFPAAWSLMLALRARGLGSTWTTLLLRERDATAKLLGIPEGVTQTVLLPVAYTKGANLRPARRKPAAQVAFWNEWGCPRQ
ncbi:MAG: nitroreductase family protein [Deltaproteobacteria bacterium]|nr:nitroreductase family protein [Deltaproteobacteria bacterium]MBW2360614.1 nitroreductase family protein [Deltaproteobacteria bacterium]